MSNPPDSRSTASPFTADLRPGPSTLVQAWDEDTFIPESRDKQRLLTSLSPGCPAKLCTIIHKWCLCLTLPCDINAASWLPSFAFLWVLAENWGRFWWNGFQEFRITGEQQTYDPGGHSQIQQPFINPTHLKETNSLQKNLFFRIFVGKWLDGRRKV